MTGTLINVGTVLAGGAIGTVLGGRFPAALRKTLMQAVGLTTLAIGIQDILPSPNPLVLLASVLIGGLIGELLRLEQGLERIGDVAQETLSRWKALPQTSVTQGFVTASLIFCVGPMTILGSFQDGLTGAYQTLALKAVLDGFTAAMLASSLGWGVLLAALTVLVYQGTLTLAAGLTRGLLTDPMIASMTAAGGLLIIGIGINILELSRIRVGSMLPSLAVAPVLAAISR